jgi:hypothetical protein
MRLVLPLLLFAAVARAALPPALAAALNNFRPDPPRGWSYTQTTAAQGESTVERYDASKPEFDRWSLVQKNGRTPTADETQTYNEIRSRHSRGGTAPKITDQIDAASVEPAGESTERATFRARLRPGESGDRTAAFLRMTLVVHKPTATIESIELASTGEFSPTFAVKIAEMKTLLTYRPPAGEIPALPVAVATHVRGRAFWFKALDADMTVTYSNYEKAARKP